MSSGFVSGGTADKPIERDDEWRQAQQEIEDRRREKEDRGKQNEGKSLFEVLQANKDAKQEAFEQAARYKLHVALDDDEADYLDGILEAKRKEEANVRKETSERLELFRQQQEEAERQALEDENTNGPKEDQVQWLAPARKRKKGQEYSLLRGVKLKRSNSATDDKKEAGKSPGESTIEQNATSGDPVKELATKSLTAAPVKPSPASTTPKPSSALSLGLGYASSDDDE